MYVHCKCESVASVGMVDPGWIMLSFKTLRGLPAIEAHKCPYLNVQGRQLGHVGSSSKVGSVIPWP